MSCVYSQQPACHSQAHTHLHSALFSAAIRHVRAVFSLKFQPPLFIGERILLLSQRLAFSITFPAFFWPNNRICPLPGLLRDLANWGGGEAGQARPYEAEEGAGGGGAGQGGKAAESGSRRGVGDMGSILGTPKVPGHCCNSSVPLLPPVKMQTATSLGQGLVSVEQRQAGERQYSCPKAPLFLLCPWQDAITQAWPGTGVLSCRPWLGGVSQATWLETGNGHIYSRV